MEDHVHEDCSGMGGAGVGVGGAGPQSEDMKLVSSKSFPNLRA